MSNQAYIVKLIKEISGQANVLTIPRIYITLTKSHRAALFLSQCVYWSDKSKDAEGWFYKTYSQWKEEIGIPRGGIETASKAVGRWVEVKFARVNGHPKNHYRVNLDVLVSDISKVLESRTSKVLDSSTLEVLENSRLSYTEITTKITNTGANPAPPVKKTRQPDLLFDAIADLCQVDPQTAGASIGKVTAALRKAAYAPEDVEKFRAWWWNDAWRARQGKPPTLWKLKEQIGVIRHKGHDNGNGKSETPMTIQELCDEHFGYNPRDLKRPEIVALWQARGAVVKGLNP
jgi:hypothetical protein